MWNLYNMLTSYKGKSILQSKRIYKIHDCISFKTICFQQLFTEGLCSFICSGTLPTSLILVSDWLKLKISWILFLQFYYTCRTTIFTCISIFFFSSKFYIIYKITITFNKYQNNCTNIAEEKNWCQHCQTWMFPRAKQ